MAEYVVSFIVARVRDLLIEEAVLLAGVSDQVQQMQAELQNMQNFLQDADKRQDENKSVRGWVSKIRDLAYDAENVIETFVLEISSRKEKGFAKKFKRYATIFVEVAKIHKVGNEIKAIQARITNLTKNLTTYGIQIKNEAEGSRLVQQKLKRSYSHLVEEHTIGLDSDVKVLVTKLRGEETDAGQIVSICGMGGLGKTTLANKLYHHVKLRDHFDAFAWYCVSQQFQARDVWEGLLIKLVSPSTERRKEISMMKDDEIAKELYLFQQKKKCLVVLDDIWNEEAWELLQPAFPMGKVVPGSKIVLTTRNKILAFHADPTAFIYELQTLNEQDSWDLFQTKAFPNNMTSDFKFNMEFKKIGMEIVKKCAGLPLAIIVLGGLLATQHSFSELEKVHKNVDLYLSKGKRENQEYSVVHGVLALSYNELPYHLKPCFLHLGHFPEDYDIPCQTLLRMWAAEGFVSQCQQVGEGNETMEDVVERYLHDLIDRSIVQVAQKESTGTVKTCRLHDLMREFCLSKANQENYLKIVRAANLNEKPNSNRVHRLVVHPNEINDFDLRYYARTPYLRSFLLLGNRVEDWFDTRMVCDNPMITSIFSYFKLLKIVSLENCRIGKAMVKEIGGLIHLRYLAFDNCEVDDIPSSIGNLRYLQTLIIRAYSCTIVPNVLWKLEQLRHLVLEECQIKGGKMLELGNLSKLETLELGDSIVFSLGQIPNVCLNRLSALYINARSRSISEEELKRFFFSCRHLLKLCYDGKIEDKLPEWQHFPANLTSLTLQSCELEEDPMPILEKLTNLRTLRLYWNSFKGRLLVCSSKGFPKLQTLLLDWLHGLDEWRVDEEAMPNLCQLHIKDCWKLKKIPEGIKFITTLRQLEITNMPKRFEDRVRVVDGEEGDDFYKVRHVPSIITKDTSTRRHRMEARADHYHQWRTQDLPPA